MVLVVGVGAGARVGGGGANAVPAARPFGRGGRGGHGQRARGGHDGRGERGQRRAFVVEQAVRVQVESSQAGRFDFGLSAQRLEFVQFAGRGACRRAGRRTVGEEEEERRKEERSGKRKKKPKKKGRGGEEKESLAIGEWPDRDGLGRRVKGRRAMTIYGLGLPTDPLSVCLLVCLSVCLSICFSVCLVGCFSFDLFLSLYLEANSLPFFVKLEPQSDRYVVVSKRPIEDAA